MIYCKTIIVKRRFKGKMKASRFLTKKKEIKLDRSLLAMHPLNYRRDPVDERDYKLKTVRPDILLEAIEYPDVVDHTKDMSPVKDQGQLGSCVGFAVSAMKECQEKKEHDEEMAKGKRGRKKIYDYSESWIYWNAKKIDPWPGEEGTSIRYALKVLQKIGVPTEKGWPYKDVGDIGEPEKWAGLVARWALIESYYRVDTLNELKVALIYGPVAIGVPCFREIFFVGADGMVPYPSNPNEMYGGHAICAVAYDNNKQLIKFKNSWGKGWGQSGYGYLPYKYVNDFLWDAWAAKDLTVTKEMLKGTIEGM